MHTHTHTHTHTHMEILNKVDTFLDRYHLSKLNQGLVNNLNRPIIPKEIEAAYRILIPPQKSMGTDSLMQNSTTLKKTKTKTKNRKQQQQQQQKKTKPNLFQTIPQNRN